MQFPTNIHIAYASDENGSNFSTVFSESMEYMAVAVSPTSPVSFSGWQKFRDSGRSATSGTVRGEEPSGQGCTFLLANVPIGDIDLFLNGQRLTRDIDYSLNGQELTMAKMISDTDILRAGYNY